jgi:hypothetical protein
MAVALDWWTISDADETWDFHVKVLPYLDAGRPEENGDVYDPEVMARIGEPEESVQWARDAVKAWEQGDWEFVILEVTPVHSETEAVFEHASVSLGGVEYGYLPGKHPVHTADRDYLRTSHLNDMITEARGFAEEQLKGMQK